MPDILDLSIVCTHSKEPRSNMADEAVRVEKCYLKRRLEQTVDKEIFANVLGGQSRKGHQQGSRQANELKEHKHTAGS